MNNMVTVYTRPGCTLCDKAISVLEQARVAFVLVDISADAGLEGEFGLRVPVVEAGRRVVFEAGMNPVDLPHLVATAGL